MIGQVRDLTGQTFGELLVIDLDGFDKHRHAMWLCQCSCGVQKVIRSNNLLAREHPTISCRHVQREMAKKVAGVLTKGDFGADHPMFGRRDSAETIAKKSASGRKEFDIAEAKRLRATGLSYRKIARAVNVAAETVRTNLRGAL